MIQDRDWIQRRWLSLQLKAEIRDEFIINAYTSVCDTKGYADCTKHLSETTMGTTGMRSPQLSPRKLRSVIQPSNSIRSTRYFSHRLGFQNSKERLGDGGDLPKWLVEQIDYWPHPQFISIWLEVICRPEGQMKAGQLPWHRLDPDGPRQKALDAGTLLATNQRRRYK